MRTVKEIEYEKIDWTGSLSGVKPPSHLMVSEDGTNRSQISDEVTEQFLLPHINQRRKFGSVELDFDYKHVMMLRTKTIDDPVAPGASPERRAQVALSKSNKNAVDWIKDSKVKPHKQETAHSVCRRNIHKWGLDHQATTAKYDWMEKRAMSDRQRELREWKLMQHNATLLADYNAHLTHSCIRVTENVSLVRWEKKHLQDLSEKEKLIPRIFKLQKEINEVSVSLKEANNIKVGLQQQVEAMEKQKSIVNDSIFF